MSKTVITKKELNVPIAVIIEVADLLLEKDIYNDIVGTDADNDIIILEVQYEREHREVIHEVEDIIADFLEEEEQGNEQEDE